MKTKNILKTICSTLLAALFIVIPESDVQAAEIPDNETICKYYFLAPDKYIDNNGSVGAYWNTLEDTINYPGVEMNREWNIGRNVFSVEVPSIAETIVFNSFTDGNSKEDFRTIEISLDGYKKDCDAENGGCPYNNSIGTENFNNWIYVLKCDISQPDESADQGAWFKINNYRHSDYFGSYDFRYRDDPDKIESDTCTYYFLAPEDWCMKKYGAENEKIGIIYYSWNSAPDYTISNTTTAFLTPAFEIGKNVFKISNVPKENTGFNFNDGVNYQNVPLKQIQEVHGIGYSSRTDEIFPEGSDVSRSKILDYDLEFETPDFNGWIFVLDRTTDRSNGFDQMYREGEWFPLNTYKNYEKYYGSYPDWYNENRQFGDLDADNTVTSSDALTTLRLSVGIGFYNDFTLSVADADKDGILTSIDALVILRSSVGLSTLINN